MNELTASVGQNGRNLEEDVRLVQRLLEAAGCNPGPIDGCCGANTIAAIRKYQCRLLSDPDGLIEPGKTTWKSLCTGDIIIPTPGEWSGDSSRWPRRRNCKA